MNKREDGLLLRLYSVFHAIPLCHIGSGSQSASISGAVELAKDITVTKEPIEQVLYCIRVGEYEEAERILALIEEYVKLRKSQDWQYVFPHPKINL